RQCLGASCQGRALHRAGSRPAEKGRMTDKTASTLKKAASTNAAAVKQVRDRGPKSRALSPQEFSEIMETAPAREQDPHNLQGSRDSMLEAAIGREVRAFRNKL